jgi:HD superfamily phosphohydrolase YqeK
MSDAFYPSSEINVGNVVVQTTSNRGWNPEEVAQRALDKIVYVSDTAAGPIRDQALAYREAVRAVLIHYLNEAVKSDRTTIANRLIAAGHPELVHILRG